MQKIILGLAGEMASGKSSVGKYVSDKYGADVFRFSNILRDALALIHRENTRENLQNMSTMLREAYGEDILARAMADDVVSSHSSVVAVDGVRRLGDIEHLKKIEGFHLVYLEADIDKCHQRISVRGENVDDNGKTFEEFKKDREREAERQITQLKQFADKIIDNNSTLEDLHMQVDAFIESVNKK